MGHSTQKQDTTSSVQWGYKTPPTTPAVEKLASDQFEVDPGLKYQYQDLKTRLRSGFDNPMGAAYNPTVKEAMIREGEEQLGQQEAQAYRQGQYDVNKLGYGRDVTVAGMTAPQLVQEGGTSKGTMTQSQSPWGAIAQGAATAAPMSM
jgi:hypothetical protein